MMDVSIIYTTTNDVFHINLRVIQIFTMLKYIIILLICNSELEARPISYSGWSTLMAFSDNMRDSVYFHYSPSYKYSIGIESISDKFFDDKYSYMRFTYLLNRKNTQDSQRNLYFQSGFGANGSDKHFIGVHGDWETRWIFAGFGF